MSNIDFINKTVTWTNNNYIGLTTEWVREMLKAGYTLIDNRKKK